MNSTEALHTAYLQWDEEVIRQAIGRIAAEAGYPPRLVLPKERLYFWMYIYGAILTMTHNVPLPEDVPPDEENYRHCCYSWWQLRQIAFEFSCTHPSVKFQPHVGKFTYSGLTYTIPKELYRVVHPEPVAAAPSPATPPLL